MFYIYIFLCCIYKLLCLLYICMFIYAYHTNSYHSEIGNMTHEMHPFSLPPLRSLKVWPFSILIGSKVHAGDRPNPFISQFSHLFFSFPWMWTCIVSTQVLMQTCKSPKRSTLLFIHICRKEIMKTWMQTRNHDCHPFSNWHTLYLCPFQNIQPENLTLVYCSSLKILSCTAVANRT